MIMLFAGEKIRIPPETLVFIGKNDIIFLRKFLRNSFLAIILVLKEFKFT